MSTLCKHKFVFARNENYWYRSSRYQTTFISRDFYFCEKCLCDEVKERKQTINDNDRHQLENWAQGIKEHGVDSHY